MIERLPSLNALKALEAAARHLSFSKAADELHVTPAAIRGCEKITSLRGETQFWGEAGGVPVEKPHESETC